MIFDSNDIDPGILPLVKLLNNNGFRPFASCDGILEHHKDKWGNPNPNEIVNAYISLMDSANTRSLFAILMDNDYFNLSISNPESPYVLYGNEISGLKFSIYFDNYRGENVNVLISIVGRIISGKASVSTQNRDKIDLICKVLSSKFIDKNLNVSFDIHSIYRGIYKEHVSKNYSVTISEYRSQKDMFELLDALKVDNPDLVLDLLLDGYCRLLLGDFEDAVTFLLSTILKYSKLNGYVEHDIIIGNNKISESIEEHIEDMYTYLEVLYRRQVDKSIRRHYKKMCRS